MKKLMYFACLCCVLVGLSSCDKKKEEVTVQGSIYGVITDFATGNPVPNANVQLRPTGETTLTGSDGNYEFPELKDGKYSITVSKAEYTDLIDDYVIQVQNGRRMRRDVQIEKIPTYIRFTDVYGNDIKELDFGSGASLNMLSFNVFNNGTENISCKVEYSCTWITSVTDLPSIIKPGQNALVSVKIDRSKLAVGQNSTKLYIKSNNGNNVILVKATSGSGNPPTVQISPIGNITATSAQCIGQLIDANGGKVSDCGFCYSKTTNPTTDDFVVRLGVRTGSFSSTLSNLETGITYHVKAFAVSNLGTGYSSEVTFTTLSGMPVCGATTITALDPTTVRAESSVSVGTGSKITEKGFCWSTKSSPTLADQKVECGFGEGSIYGYLTSLQPSTTYWVRSYATNEFGTAYGPELSFISHTGLATLTTTSPTISGDKIITGGNITDDAGTVIIDRGVCYGSERNPNLSWSFEHTYDGTGGGKFSSSIPKPSKSGYIYIRAYATTQYGTAYGNEVSIYVH